MYQQTYQHKRPRRMGSYFLPFLSIIILGLIVVLVFQIVGYFQEKRSRALENKAAVKIIAGRAEMKLLGIDQWTPVIDGSILNDGDAIRTDPGSRIVMTLLNGSIIRLRSETEVELAELKSKSGQDEIAFVLKNGDIWLKRSLQETVRTSFRVVTPHLEINSLGTIFDVSNTEHKESLHVLEGKVNAAVKLEDSDTGRMRTVETLEVSLGQEISISKNDINSLRSGKVIDLLALLSDEFRQSDWYTWNRSEDLSGREGLSVADALDAQKERTLPGFKSITSGTSSDTTDEVSVVLSPPEILAPKPEERVTRTGSITISGTVDKQTEKVEVTSFIGGRPESYILQKYRPGTSAWSYVASREYGNLVPGENRFTIRAIGKDGRKSDLEEFTILYDKPKEPADLSAPTVSTFNGISSPETMEDAVKVEGKIGKGIVKVFVNNFVLTRYIPDSGVWFYYAKTAYGNLKEGENSYEIYGVDADGNKTPIAKFTITKKAGVPAPAVGSSTPPL